MTVDLNQKNLADLGYLIAEAPKNVVFVVGAGLSRPAGVPLWPEFQDAMAAEIRAYLTKRSEKEQQQFDEAYAAQGDPWFRGNLLEESYPQNLYVNAVRRFLTPRSTASAYSRLWRLKPSGVLSLNLDGLAAESADIRPERRATASEPSKFQRFLLLAEPYVFQAHGTLRESNTWVLSARARQRLLQDNHEYRRFMIALFQSRRLVLLGLRPDDFAFQSLLLEDFRRETTTGVHHFWITEALTPAQQAWARQYNLAPIEYSPATSDHPEMVAVLEHLATYSPRTGPPAFSYAGPAIDPLELPPDQVLRQEPIEDIRRKLNAAAKGLLDRAALLPHEKQLASLEDLLSKYSGSAHMAWLLTASGDYDRFFGCRVTKRLGEGTFGEIWQVEDPVDGTTKVAKILRRELASGPEFVEAFRRGVQAARILTERGVTGMVRLLSSYEIPPCLFMEYIDGPTLANVMAAGQVKSLERALGILADVASIVRSAHNLPENVLHRDIKPSNVMIENYYSDPSGGTVKVLDFDLSWYEGAAGRTMLGGARYQGYAAPEQLSSRPTGVSTRHKAVDVFGLGMLLYFLATKRDPAPNIQKDPAFEANTRAEIAGAWKLQFPSIGWYLAGLIAAATADRQEDRISLPTFISRLELVRTALSERALPVPSDLVLVELLERLSGEIWKAEPLRESSARLRSGAGELSLQFEDSGVTSVLGARIVFNAAGDMHWGSIRKFMQKRLEQTVARMKEAGFQITETNASGGALVVAGRRAKSRLTTGDLAMIADGLREAAERATFGA